MHDPEKIKAARESADLTQAAAAKKAGMPFQQWNDIESGRAGAKRGVSWPTLEKVARALSVLPVELLKGAPATPSPRKKKARKE